MVDKKKIDFKLLLRIYKYIKPFKGLMLTTLAIIIVLSFLTPEWYLLCPPAVSP